MSSHCAIHRRKLCFHLPIVLHIVDCVYVHFLSFVCVFFGKFLHFITDSWSESWSKTLVFFLIVLDYDFTTVLALMNLKESQPEMNTSGS